MLSFLVTAFHLKKNCSMNIASKIVSQRLNIPLQPTVCLFFKKKTILLCSTWRIIEVDGLYTYILKLGFASYNRLKLLGIKDIYWALGSRGCGLCMAIVRGTYGPNILVCVRVLEAHLHLATHGRHCGKGCCWSSGWSFPHHVLSLLYLFICQLRSV